MTVPFHRPEPLPLQALPAVDLDSRPAEAARSLLAGKSLLVQEHYHVGVAILESLHRRMEPPADDAPYAQRKAFDRAWRETASRLLVAVHDHEVHLIEVANMGFLPELYPDQPSFLLPFLRIQELFGAWERYAEGTHLAVLGHRVHPWYGTYAPTRTEHLELFATWLAQHDGSRNRAIDVGTGCGVLALMLAKAGFAHIRATDHNPNALESVRRDLARLDPVPPITPVHGDLLAEPTEPADLIVFNPPWMKGPAESLIDGALYFQDGLFERFFDQALDALAPDGRVVLLFSTILTLVQPDEPHPIEAELARGRLKLVARTRRKVKPTPGPDGRKRRTKERVEVWELARA